jgi:hypothetical protein
MWIVIRTVMVLVMGAMLVVETMSVVGEMLVVRMMLVVFGMVRMIAKSCISVVVCVVLRSI